MLTLDTAYLITAFVTLLVVIDPIAIVPIFIALTRDMLPEKRRKIAWRAIIVSAILLALFTVAGHSVLTFIGISMPAFRVAGGMLLFLTALDMLFERRTKRRKGQAQEAEAELHHDDDEDDDPSVFPLAIPLIAGPGSIASVILLASEKPGIEGTITVLLITGVVLGIMGLTLQAGGMLERWMGKTAINVTTRLLGMLLAALSVQFVLDGLIAFGFGPTGQ